MGGVGPIPLAAYLSYFQIYRIESIEERDWLVRLMRQLDGVYLDWQAKKSDLKNRQSE